MIREGSAVRVRADVKNEDKYDFVEDWAGKTGTVEHHCSQCFEGDSYDWCVRMDGTPFTQCFRESELEEVVLHPSVEERIEEVIRLSPERREYVLTAEDVRHIGADAIKALVKGVDL